MSDYSEKFCEIAKLNDKDFTSQWTRLFFEFLGNEKIDLIGIGHLNGLETIDSVKEKILDLNGQITRKTAYLLHQRIQLLGKQND